MLDFDYLVLNRLLSKHPRMQTTLRLTSFDATTAASGNHRFDRFVSFSCFFPCFFLYADFTGSTKTQEEVWISQAVGCNHRFDSIPRGLFHMGSSLLLHFCCFPDICTNTISVHHSASNGSPYQESRKRWVVGRGHFPSPILVGSYFGDADF